MANSYATSRETETGTIIEDFIDSYTTEDFAIGGYEDLINKLEVIAGKVDDNAKELESRIEELEDEVRKLEGE